jgi:hypothetical protein
MWRRARSDGATYHGDAMKAGYKPRPLRWPEIEALRRAVAIARGEAPRSYYKPDVHLLRTQIRRQWGGALLLELMLVCCIGAILAMAAVPNYTAHYARKQLAQVITDLVPVKADIGQMINCSAQLVNGAMTLNALPHYLYSNPYAPCQYFTPYVDGRGWGQYCSSLTFDGTNLVCTMGTNALPVLRGGVLTETNIRAQGTPMWTCKFSNPVYTPWTC